MRTILLCTQTASPVGGTQNWLEQLDRSLPAHGWRVVVALAWGHAHHDPQAFLEQHSLSNTILLDARTGTEAGRRQALHRAIHAVKPDVVVPVTLLDPLGVMADLKRCPNPPRLVYVAHEVSATMLQDARVYAPVIDRAVGVSRLLSVLLQRVAEIPADRVARIPYGFLAPWRPHVPRPAGAPLRLGYVGRIDPDKRPLDLLPLCEELDKLGVPCHLTVVGDGSQGQALREAMAARVARGTVVLRGPMSIRALYDSVYSTLDCAILCSPSEGFPLMVLEAMLHGVVPVVSNYRGRAPEGLIGDGETGLVFPIGDMAAAAGALARLHQDAALVERLSRNARKHAEAGGYTIERHARQWSDLLDDVLRKSPALGVIPDNEPGPAGRLDKVLGPGLAEFARRLFRRRFPHRDLSEWPHTRPWPAEVLTPLEEEIAAAQRELG
jgi:glycosyltransferase involved in cell wall biosynthesis